MNQISNGTVATVAHSSNYDEARNRIYQRVADQSLDLCVIERSELEKRVVDHRPLSLRGGPTLEQRCVNYLRHKESRYDELIRMLNCPTALLDQPTDFERHVLHFERRKCHAIIRKRIFDEIAEHYPWLATECIRQKKRDGVEDNPSEFIMPFGPFKGKPLSDIDENYLFLLLGHFSIRKGFRTRIERFLAEKMARRVGG